MAAGLIGIALAQAEPAAPSKSLLDHIASGGPIGFAIIALSLVAVTLAVMQLLQVRERKLTPPEVVEGLDKLLSANDIRGAIRFCQDPVNDSFLARMFAAALTRCSRSAFGLLELRSALEEAGQEQVARLHRATDGIGLIAAVAPMLGLLGTVVGMVGAFETISFSEHATVGGESLWERNEIGIRGTQRFDIVVHDVGTATAPGPIVGLRTGDT